MSNENEPIPTPAAPLVDPVLSTSPSPAELIERVPEPVQVRDTPLPAKEEPLPQPPAPAREEMYPRADDPVESDRDVAQTREDGEAGVDGEEDADGAEFEEDPEPEASPGAPTPSVTQNPSQDASPPTGAQPREGGRRRRRRRRGGRGGQGQDRNQGQSQSNSNSGHTQQEKSGSEGREHPQRDGRDRYERHGQERRDQGRRDFGRERRGPERRADRREDRREDRGGFAQERTNSGRGVRGPLKREVLANTNFEETRIAIIENGRLSELHWERKSSQNIVGNIYKGTVENVLPGISSAFVNIGFDKNSYLYISDVLGDKNAPIDQTLKKGQTIMVQVAKEAISTKGPKVTMDVSLPGRYLVFTPFQEYVGISKHIADPEERRRLEVIVESLVKAHLGGKGVVVRTEAEGATQEELEREVKYLQNLWQQVQKKFADQPAPAILHQDLDLALQIARDILSEHVYVYMIDSKQVHKEVVDFVEGFAPELKDRVKLHEAKTPIFKAFNLEKQIESIRETKVSLPNGGSIVIQEAESLCAIDVNTGRFTGSKSQEETVTQTNIEAAMIVAQQIRLRNIGGIIVVDFIDMRKASNRAKVMEAFADACRRDRAKIRILPITRLGLIELTRERKRMSTASLLTVDCPQCRASGRVLSSETLRIKIQREIFEMTGGRPGGSIRVSLHPTVAEAFRSQLRVIEKNVQRAIRIQADANLQWEDYHIVLE
ncbi:MAG: Rne/Rng family ribonuclease [Elusimicrobiota bacterium]